MIALMSPPMPHRATLERNVEAGLSETRQPLAPSYDVVDEALPCAYWEPERAIDGSRGGLREGPNVVLVAVGPRMLIRRRADVRVGDVVAEVRAGAEVVTAQRMRVTEVLWRRSHQDVGMELISSGGIQEVGS